MKVAIVHLLLEPVVGAGMAVKSAAVSRALATAGADVRLITTDLGLDDRSAPDVSGVDVVILPTWFRRFSIPASAPGRIAGLLRDRDAILLMNHWSALNAMAARSARQQGVPFGLCPGGALEVQGRSQSLKRVYHALVGRRLVRDAGIVVATTSLEARQFASYGIPATRVRVIPNGVDIAPQGLSADDFRAAHGLPAGCPMLLFMGRFNAIKGPDLLLQAFAAVSTRFPEWRLVYAGRDEGLEGRLREHSGRNGLSGRVHFVNHLNASASTGAYRAASLLAVPSRHEAMSLVALESGAVGTPVLLTDACGFDDVERVGGGRVVAPTVAGLTAGLSHLLSRPEDLPGMGERLQAFVQATFGWPKIVTRYIDLFTELSDLRRGAS